MIKITFPDGSIKEFGENVTPNDVAMSISPSLAKKCAIAKVNDCFYDMFSPIKEDSSIQLLAIDSEGINDILNHSCAHLLAHAIKELYPKAMFGVGPAIEEGFYYDMDLGDVKLTDEDLVKIEKKMTALVASGTEIKKKVVSKEQALDLFKDDIYKTELIKELPNDEEISIYEQGSFRDLCRGPHVSSTKWLKNFKLLSVSGAYWRGDSKNAQLQRVYGTCFAKESDLKQHLINLEERKKRDHRKLGKELELFMISEYGPGFPFWLPNGMILRRNLENFWYDIHTKRGYQFVQTPVMLSKELWETSGHWYNYKENMYTSMIAEQEFAIKPMNCPGGMLVYKNSIHSYRDFPLRIGELGLVHRHEASGALAGLFRVRNFTQDDAHIFITEAQIEDEVMELLDLFDSVYRIFNLSYHIELSTRPEDKYIGEIETWNKAEAALAQALKHKNIDYIVNPGDGAFYGPKLDFKLKDSMNRIWQCGTIQLDMNLPERFDLTYVSENGEKLRPIMLHRAVFGSIERFIGIITEHFGGAFPLWLAPKQIVVIPVNNEAHSEYAKKICDDLCEKGLRASLDMRDEKLNYKIRESQTKKIPYTLVLGDKEANDQTITYRAFGNNETITISYNDFVEKVKSEIKSLGQK